MSINITTPLTKEKTANLKAGDIVNLTGTIYTSRDAAHKRMIDEYEKTGKFPFDMENAIIYYAGPSPAKPNQVIGSAGPTTSGRMDAYAPFMIEKGETGMIGKGARNENVINAMKKHTAVYFGATGGAGALISSHIKKCELIAYEDLGAEAVYKLYVENFPLVVIIDCEGNNLYETEKLKYQK